MIKFPEDFKPMRVDAFKLITDSPLSSFANKEEVKLPVRFEDDDDSPAYTPVFGVYSLTKDDNPTHPPLKELVGVSFDGNFAIEAARNLADVPKSAVPTTKEGGFTFYCDYDEHGNEPWYVGFTAVQLEAL